MKIIRKTTSMGIIRGLLMDDQTCQFRGIRYATAERWKYPVPVEQWSSEYDATEFGAACYQNRSFRDEASQDPLPFYYKEFREHETYHYSENCLFLNIYAPEHAEHADVLLYIHGGAFMGGCGNEKHMDGTEYAKRGIIFVSINYRLGPLGFLCDRQLTEESGHSGNYGLYDQLAAIRWVYDHIAEFGGNPEKITLFGQSAGAMSIQQHVLSPLTKPYIHGAYMASGGGIGETFARVGAVEDSYDYCARMTTQLGANPDEWRQKSVEEIYEAFWKIADREVLSHFCPHVDGLLIPEDPKKALEQHKQAHIPYLMSTNADDMLPDILHEMAFQWCEAVQSDGDPAYCFRFNRHLPGDDAGAFHSAELWYTMGAFDQCWRPMTDWDREIREVLLGAITAFVHSGNPNSTPASDHAWKPVTSSDAKLFVITDDAFEFDSRSDISSDTHAA